MIAITITDNILAQVCQQIVGKTTEVLDGAGTLYWNVARNECPISNIDEPGYVHLVETINYEVEPAPTFHMSWVTFFVIKNYAQFVNDGTARMPPRPFFTDGVLAVSDGIDNIVDKVYRDLQMGRAQVRR